MAKVQALVSNFTAGEFSPRLYGRPDIAKYKNAVKTLENFTVVPHGGARKRPGSKFVIEVKDSAQRVRLVPFQYSTEQTYMLLFGPSYVWFCTDQAIITHATVDIIGATNANPCVITTDGAHGITDGAEVFISGISGMHQLNNRHFTVTGATATTFQLQGIDSTSYGTYGSGGVVGRIVEITTAYAAAQLDELQFAQSADTLYITHPSHKPAKITRSSHTSWSLSDVAFQKGPFRTINTQSSLTITPSSFSASATGYGTHQVGTTCTLTASSPLFDVGMVDGLFRLNESSDGETGVASAALGDSTKTLANNDTYTTDSKIYGVTNLTGAITWELFNRVPHHSAGRVRIYGGTGSGIFFDSDYLHSGWCVVRITGYTSTTVVTAEIVYNQMPRSVVGGTSFWEEGAFSAYRGYPRAVTFFEQRLFLAGTNANPQTIYGSRTAAFEDFEDGADDDDALVFTVASGTVDAIRWLSGGRLLSCGTAAGEFAVAGTTNNEALTPTNVRVIPQTSLGSSAVQPVRLGQIVLFPQRSGNPDNDSQKLREHVYQYESDAFSSSDLTVFSEHITGAGFTKISFQIDPDSVVWLRRTDGKLAGVTYERDQEVIGWHRHTLGGTALDTSGNDAFTKVLLQFDGLDGSTTIVDSSPDPKPFTVSSGDAELDDGQVKFGPTSLFVTTGTGASTPSHPSFALGTSDFTIDCWFRIGPSSTDGAQMRLCGHTLADATDSSFQIFRSATTNLIDVLLSDGSTIVSRVASTTTFTTANPGWHHLAVSRAAGTLRLFINGVEEDSASFPDAILLSNGALAVGGRGGGSTINPWNGWIDEWRLSVGVARWTEDFTPPTNPYVGVAGVEDVASVPGAQGDDLYLEVARIVNGQTKRYVEVLSTALRIEDDKVDGVYLDGAATYSGASTSTIGSLWHLEGQTVDVLNNGAVERGKTVSNGAITLDNATTLAHVGLRYTSVLETLDLEAGAQAGTAQSRVGRISQVFIRLYRSLGGSVGPDADHQDDILYRTPAELMGSSPALFSGLKPVDFPGGFSEEGRFIRIEHDDPLPMFVTGIVAEVSTAG